MKNLWKAVINHWKNQVSSQIMPKILLDYPSHYSSNDQSKQNHQISSAFYANHLKDKANQEAGFTLMELLIVLALVAVMSMIAVPIYRNYVQSAKITEGMTLASAMQLDAEVYYTLNGKWPDNNKVLGLPDAESYRGNSVDSIQLEGETITVTFNDDISGEKDGAVQLILTGNVVDSGLIRWKCEGINIKESDLPSSCKS
ncbi:hypothetical protein DC083_00355 [Ignatzschineria ureiclastica]|uniref:Prepilin-type cleavage/methylation domain-containing protein n=1 Tax=Ignatzschineria ureiclastica TaxID=472582 RepID=A0A2U2AG99_9GAMM|nr:pilin [Ignatzschineria ureiclastica]PWD81686.1 hypothetical protein DC083_00355 [Ignatzschineria ureiclastica]GGZ89918.1 hypothetical protein GCM10007162_00700 [Ignatzschineria ureiclastica]